MKFIIILVAMAAAGGGALHSWQSRTQFVQAALLSEAFSVVAEAKLSVGEYHVQHGVMPHDNAETGLPPPRSFYGSSVKRVTVRRGGALTVDFEEESGRRAMTFMPNVSPVSGLTGWQCTSDSIERRVLARLKPDCAYRPSTPERRLMHAISNRDLARVDALLEEGASPEAIVNGNTPLILASTIGEPGIVEALLSKGALVDTASPDIEGQTPLMVAIEHDHADIVALLLVQGASAYRKDGSGMSVIDHAVATDRRLAGTRYRRMLSARGLVDVEGSGMTFDIVSDGIGDPVPGDRELAVLYRKQRSAAANCRVKRLIYLLDEEVDIDVPDMKEAEPWGREAVRHACRRVLERQLPEKGRYVLARDGRLRDAVKRCDANEVDTVLDANVAIDVQFPHEGVSPFESALSSGCDAVTRLMIDQQKLKGRLAEDVLLYAIRRSPQSTLVHIIGTLIAAEAAIDTRDEDGRTALSEAIALEQPVVAKYLVDAGADVNAMTANASYPLIEATKKGYGHLMVQLIRRGADVNGVDALGRTALIAAVASGRQHLVDELVRAGADIHQRDRNGIDALLLAETRNMRQIRSSLLATAEN